MPVEIQKVFTFSGHDAPVYELAFFEENKIISGGGDRIITLLNINDIENPVGIVNTGSTIYSLKYIPGKNILLAGVSSGGLHVIDLNHKKETHFLMNHLKGIFNICYSEINNLIFTSGGDGKISAWSADDFTFIKSLEVSSEKIRSIITDRSEKFLIAACGDGTIRIFSLPALTETHRFNAHNSSVNSICFHPEKNILISGGKDAHLNFWSTDDYKLIQSIPAHNYAIYSISFSPSGKLFATASRDKTIKLWNSNTNEIALRIDFEKNSGHTFSVNKLLWIKNLLISAGDDKKIIGWKIDDSGL
jgi:WD40 repeat protein